ncbi:MAG TPA: cell wall-binding repeat-containing protein, partial [Euzebya sp.]|nr:cell wall-binding repeat-containing protein [Euzebya sp.]
IALQTVECAAPADVDTVLIGRDDDFADSLSSGYLQQDAPLLLVPGGGPIPPDVIATLERLSPSQIIIMGGDSAISPAVEQALIDLGIAVVRREGGTRIETAIDVASTDASDATTAIIARAFPGVDPTQGFADAIAAGGMAADLGYPVLLTDTAQLSLNTATYLRDSTITDVFIMGGTAAVSALTESQIAEIIPGIVTRVAGDSRFGTSVEIAKERGSQSAADVAQLIMVEGQGGFAWAGGLTAAYQAAQDDAPIVLLNGGEVPPETAAYLTPNAGFAVDTDDVIDGALTCAGISDGCLEARRLLGLDGTTVTFDPPTLTPAVLDQQIEVSFADQPPASAEVVYDGSCLIAPTSDPEAVIIRGDAGGPPLPCLVTVTITYDSGVVQTSVAAYE